MKVGLMWHGNREARDTVNLAESKLNPTAEAFREEGIEAVACVYNDEFVDEVREQLLGLDGVQVWVNPITEDGHTRSALDSLLREVADRGVFVSSHPDTIQKIGTKTVLHDTRNIGWAGDVHLYRSVDEMRGELPNQLANGPRVIKQHRGHSGQGVWRLTPVGGDCIAVKPAGRGTNEENVTIDEWVESCRPFFEVGPMLDQEYNLEIARGMIRCYLVRDKVEGFGHQELNALVPGTEPGPRLYFPPDRPDFQPLKQKLESDWLPQLMQTVGLEYRQLPHLWDLDFMLKGGGYMLCEINVSAVYPYPESAMRPLARAFKERLTGA